MENISVSIIQTNLIWENTDVNLNNLSEKIKNTASGDLIVLPEMFTTGFSMNPSKLAEEPKGKTFNWLLENATKYNTVITGSYIVKENGNYYNRLYWVQPDGNYYTYNKKHLFRYGNEHEHYMHGDKKLIVKYKGWKICPLICYDLRFPVFARNKWSSKNNIDTLDAEYDLLIYVANWPERRNHPWKTLLQARAIENQSYVVGVNRVGTDGNNIIHSGDSAIIDFTGNYISAINPHEEKTITHTLLGSALIEFRKTFPAGMDADDFNII